MSKIIKERPTSPHLTIYKPQISSVLSISHRMTGVALFFGLSVISWWIVSFIFFGPCKYVMYFINTWIFCLAIKALSFCGFYHFFNGIRHLFWDMGIGFSISELHFSGWLVVVASILSTITIWSIII
ncbi:MAG: succinate dehydrogenase, cytochrome b556 subunit [Alphaproteobacteria bacterium]|nr:succinate dehydrogenase, cytochrome b556 subunit [Alphaproteobacteria bacterium]